MGDQKHLIFFVHGMGDYSNNWLYEQTNPDKQTIPELLKEKWNNYSQLKAAGSFDDFFQCVGLYYNNHFEDRIEQWNELVKDLETGIAAAGVSSHHFKLDKVIDIVSETEKDDFIYTHLLDVALYYLKLVRGPVTNSITTQILEKIIVDDPTQRPSFSIIAHSLGTMVIHDALQALYTGEQAAISPSDARPTCLIQVANVSRLLRTDSNPYSSVVHPGINSWEGVCDKYINVAHKLDPFLIPKPFEISKMRDYELLFKKKKLKDIEIHRVTDLNVHDFHHYLNNPNVHEAIFKCLTSSRKITDLEHQKAIEAFKETTLSGGAETVLDELETLDIKSIDSWKALFTALKTFLKKFN